MLYSFFVCGKMVTVRSSSMLEEIKRHVMDVAKRAQDEGMCKHKSGNFSQRDPETGYIVVTPSGVDRKDLQVRDMVVMDLDGNVIENPTGLKPTSEAMMHIVIYKERPDVMAVAHTHSMYATTFAVLNKPVPAVVYEMFNLNAKKGRIPVAPYGRPGTKELAESVVDCVHESDGFLLQAHGSVAVDEKDIEGAYLKVSYVEELSELYYHTLSVNGGKEPPVLPAEELQKWSYPKEIHFQKEK